MDSLASVRYPILSRWPAALAFAALVMAACAQASDAGDVEPAALQRIRPRTILTFVALGLAFYLLIPQVASVSHVWSKITNA